MIFDAYKVAVHLSVVDKVSPVLALMSRRLQSTGADVAGLEKRLKRLSGLAIGGAVTAGIGTGMLSMLRGPVQEAIEYERAFARFKQLNLGDAINADAQKFTKGTKVFGASAIDLTNTLRDLHAVMGNYDEAKAIAPKFAQLSASNAILFNGKGQYDEREARAIMKVAEMRGGKNSLEAFWREVDIAQKFKSGTGGAVTGIDLQNFSMRAGTAMRGLGDDAFLKWEPLIQELGGSSAGTAFMSMYQNLVAGRTTMRAAGELMKLGLLDPKKVQYTSIGTIKRILPGALTNNDLAKSDMLGWIEKTLLPSLAKHGITAPDQISGAINDLLTNRTGSNVASISATQMGAILKNFGVNKNSMGVDETIANAQSTTAGAAADLAKKWIDLKIIMGEAVTPALKTVVSGLTWFLETLRKYPNLTKTLVIGFAGLAAALAFGGTVILLTAAFGGLKIVMGALAVGLGLISWPVLGAVAAIAALGTAIWYFWDDLKDIYKGVRHFLGLSTGGASGSWGEPTHGASASWKTDGVAPRGIAAKEKSPTILTMDGRVVGEIISKHQGNSLMRPQTGPSRFDMNMAPMPAGVIR